MKFIEGWWGFASFVIGVAAWLLHEYAFFSVPVWVGLPLTIWFMASMARSQINENRKTDKSLYNQGYSQGLRDARSEWQDM